jgi:asparagine synthase (glutamine-hydrolysing)
MGIIRPGGRVVPEEVVQCRDMISHRGPDDAGLWISPDQTVGLGHHRLSIIDLSPLGHQPMRNEDESLWLVYNGEIYNFGNIRGELEKRGHIFRSRADSESILHAYEEWGTACLGRFNGIFAFALWDERSRRLFAARDRLGVKPLYYWHGTQGTLVFASELKALMVFPGLRKRVDLDSLWWYLAFQRVPAPRTILQDCACLAPGHYMIFDVAQNRLDVVCYWAASEIATQGPLDGDEVQWEEQLDTLLRDAVKSQLVSDVPIGAFLSGGIDSTSVVAMMAQANAETRTFTIGFTDQVDEAPYARRIAQVLGTHHQEMYVSQREMLEFVPHLADVYDEPLADSSVIPTYWVSRLTRQHVTVALSGDGGDELFGGYGLQYDRISRWCWLTKVPYSLRHSLVQAGNVLPWGKIQKAINVLDFEDLQALVLNLSTCWRPFELRRLLPGVNVVLDGWTQKVSSLPFLNRLMLNDLTTRLPDEYLVKVDRASMAVSLEVRVPMLDHRLVEFALRLPSEMKIKGSTYKVLLKRVLRKYVPPELWDRPKQGFGAPLDVWLRGELRWMIDDYLHPEKIRHQELFEERVVRAAIQHFLNGQASHYRVWSLIVFEMWMEKYQAGV